MVGASMQNMTTAEVIFAMDQEIEDTIKAFAEGEYGVAIRKDEEAKVRPSARECKKNPSVELCPETTKTLDFGPFSPCSEDQTDQIAVQVHDSIPTCEETMIFLLSVYVRVAEKDNKRKLAIANWDWENVVDLINCEDGPDADGKADDFYATDNDDLYDSDSDELADSVLCKTEVVWIPLIEANAVLLLVLRNWEMMTLTLNLMKICYRFGPNNAKSTSWLGLELRTRFSYHIDTNQFENKDWEDLRLENSDHHHASTADELFSDGKILPEPMKSKTETHKPTPSRPEHEELKQQNSKSFWGFKRSSSCSNGYGRSLCPIALLSRSHSTGSSTGSKQSSSSSKEEFNKKYRHVQKPSVSQRHPLRKTGYGYGNNTSNGIRVNPVLNLGFGSFFTSNSKNKNKK
ncbi:hypothetical protein L1987_51436 [Smallanthus sonchifolius]|uniref:Uncharacterized protein n=1 Tax=Smallanthus sonchifolius TaxID=185202 RepID=A0ACB9EQQ8_9ASTR|nr:hypothetical protein L1987_51436 [Smallanthus sonchifolius]